MIGPGGAGAQLRQVIASSLVICEVGERLLEVLIEREMLEVRMRVDAARIALCNLQQQTARLRGRPRPRRKLITPSVLPRSRRGLYIHSIMTSEQV